MSTMSRIDEAVSFFSAQVVNPHAANGEDDARRYAHSLVNAERWAERHGYDYVWSDDWDLGVSHARYYSDEAYPNGEPGTCEQCTLVTDTGDVLASLGCIDDATDDYRRVVQAELASQAMAEAAAAEGAQAEAVRQAALLRAAAVGVEQISLCGGNVREPVVCGVPQRVFGELLRIGIPVVNHYLSDFYHDALWLSRNITDDEIVTFYYAVRDCGTHLVTPTEWIEAVKSVSRDTVVYSCAVICDERGGWFLALSRCDAMG